MLSSISFQFNIKRPVIWFVELSIQYWRPYDGEDVRKLFGESVFGDQKRQTGSKTFGRCS